MDENTNTYGQGSKYVWTSESFDRCQTVHAPISIIQSDLIDSVTCFAKRAKANV